MKNVLRALLALPVLALISGTVSAQELERPTYNFVGLSYVYGTSDVDSDNIPDSFTDGDWYFGEGGQLDASFALNDLVLFRGNYYTGSGEYRGDFDIDYTTGTIGVGLIAPTDDAVGIDISLEYRKDEIELEDEDEDVDGLGLSFGLRAAITEAQEIGLRVGVYAGDFEEAVGIRLDYGYNFSDNWGVTAGYEYIDISPESGTGSALHKWLIGGRFMF